MKVTNAGITMLLQSITNNLNPDPENNPFKMINSPETKDILYAPTTPCINLLLDTDLCVAPFPKTSEENLILIIVVKDPVTFTGPTPTLVK